MSKQSSKRQLNPYYAEADSRMQEMMAAAQEQVYGKKSETQSRIESAKAPLAIEPEPEEQDMEFSEVQEADEPMTPQQLALYFAGNQVDAVSGYSQ